MTQATIQRKELLKAILCNRNVTSVDVREINFEPGQMTGRHLHPCPVLGYIVEGTATLQIEGQPADAFPAGSAFFEPAETVVANVWNPSETQPLKFIAIYPLNGQQELITMLESK